MSILLYAESAQGKVKKVGLELASYAKKISESTSQKVIAVLTDQDAVSDLSQYGVDQIVVLDNQNLDEFNANLYAKAISQVAGKYQASTVLISSTADSLYLGGILAVELGAGYASNVIALPVSFEPFKVKRNAFSNKAFQITELTSEVKLLSLAKNSFGLVENQSTPGIEHFTAEFSDNDQAMEVENTEKLSGKIAIADAEIVVSGGRGLKGPENWALVEELADVLGAATACSKPVSDIGWRPHSEHVGQTGKPVAANLYIAIGISGAIQHIAGINASKVKVVINTDSEAPFFKVADYGIVGDAFEVVPALIEKIKAFKSSSN